MSPAKKKALIRRDHPDLSVSRQCSLLKLSRSSLYYTPVGIDAETLEVMKTIDKVFTVYPFFGSRRSPHTCAGTRPSLAAIGCAV